MSRGERKGRGKKGMNGKRGARGGANTAGGVKQSLRMSSEPAASLQVPPGTGIQSVEQASAVPK